MNTNDKLAEAEKLIKTLRAQLDHGFSMTGPNCKELFVYGSKESIKAVHHLLLERHTSASAPAVGDASRPRDGWGTEKGGDERVQEDSYLSAVEAARSAIGPARPDDDEPEDQWFWDKLTSLMEILDATAEQAPAVGGDPAIIEALTSANECKKIDIRERDAAIAGWAKRARDAEAALTAATQGDARDVLTYNNKPGNVEAWRLGEACRHAQPGGDPIDHGLSLLQKLQEKGFGVVRLAAISAQAGGEG